MSLLRRITAAGSHREIGRALGLAGRDVVHAHLTGHPFWHEVTGAIHAPLVARLAEATQARFPDVWQEIEGLADGLELPLARVFAWNCRGDILASAADGCTTVMVPGAVPILAHNEDGLPFFRNHCLLADLLPAGQPGFLSFCYPGSIPGHTFAATRAGLVQTVNNIRLTGVVPDIPRMVLGRAVLCAATLDAAIDTLRGGAGSGGFHFALSRCGDRRLLSIEFGRGVVSVVDLDVPAVHANHALHAAPELGPQVVTRSSADRQARGDRLLEEGAEPLSILRDGAGPGLPIRRDAADDPDDENTMATVLFEVQADAVRWAVHALPAGAPEAEGVIRIGPTS